MKNFFKTLLLVISIVAWAVIIVTQVLIAIENIYAMLLAYVGGITIGLLLGLFMVWLLFDLGD
jgi:hypothetical protein